MAYYIVDLVFIWNSNMAVQKFPFDIRLGNNNQYQLGKIGNNNQFQLGKIGSGAFGDTYIGTNIHTGEEGRVYYL